MCFFQTLRPTESHSQTPSYWGIPINHSRNSSLRDDELFKNDGQIWTCRKVVNVQTGHRRGLNYVHFCCDQNWTAAYIQYTVDIKWLSVKAPEGTSFLFDKNGSFWVFFISGIEYQERIIKHEYLSVFSFVFFFHFRFVSLVRDGRHVGWLARIAGPSGPGISRQTT